MRLSEGGSKTGEPRLLKVDALAQVFHDEHGTPGRAKTQKWQRSIYLRVAHRLSPEMKELDLTMGCCIASTFDHQREEN